jgi:elongation factor 2
VSYRETVRAKSNQTCMAKSPNKHNRVYGTADAMHEDLQAEIESEKIIPTPKEPKDQAKYVAEHYGFDSDDVIIPKKLWAFGPAGNGPNWLMDGTVAVQYLQEIKDSMVNAFQQITYSGPLCEEACRGVIVRLLDVVMHADAIHRGMGQIVPAARRMYSAAMYTAEPAIMEPMYLAEITVPSSEAGSVHSLMALRRGEFMEEIPREGTPMTFMKFALPVNESFGFTGKLREATGGKAFPQCSFSHWKMMDGDVLSAGSKVFDIVTNTRTRKGLKGIPALDEFLDKL